MTVIGSFKVTQGHRFCYRSKARMWLPIQVVNNTNLLPTSHRSRVLAVCIGQIIAVDRGAYLTPSLGRTLNSGLRNLPSKTIETSPCHVMYSIFRYTEPFACVSPAWQTDGQNFDSNIACVEQRELETIYFLVSCLRIELSDRWHWKTTTTDRAATQGTCRSVNKIFGEHSV